MILFFATVTVIVPAMVLMGIIIFTAHDAREHCHVRIPRKKAPASEWPE
jgi:hypothetical protein